MKSIELISALLGRAGVNSETILRSFEKEIAELSPKNIDGNFPDTVDLFKIPEVDEPF